MNTSTNRNSREGYPRFLVALAFIVGGALMFGLGALLTNITERQVEARLGPVNIQPIPEDATDPAVWGVNFPAQYSSFIKTADDTMATKYGGSRPNNKLEAFPILKRLWGGYPFATEFNEERGHHYALKDQQDTQRLSDFTKRAGACANCHTAEARVLIKQMGWEAFNKGPYSEFADKLHTGISCGDCHDNKTMSLVITRPALDNALKTQGIDWRKASRQEMRTFVCAQCHVEYYFAGDNKILTFPWAKGMNIDQMDEYYSDIKFKDWDNAETKAPMIKVQHPETELYSTGIHAASGVSCADCHMPYKREGGQKVTDHWARSPMLNINNACQTCHQQDENALKARITLIQDRTASLLRTSEGALANAMDAVIAAKAAGATDEQLKDVYTLIRRSQLRWDFIFSENSTGFHSPQEAARVLAMSIDFARRAELGATKLNPKATVRTASTAAP